KLAALGKTRIVAPVGDKLISTRSNRATRIRDITDGTAATIMLVEADDEHAVIWTKPDDLDVDLDKPLAGLAIRPPGGFLVLMADGRIHFLRGSIKPQLLAGFFTRASGEANGVAVVPAANDEFPIHVANDEFPSQRSSSPFALDDSIAQSL